MFLNFEQMSEIYNLCDYYECMGIKTTLTIADSFVSVKFNQEGTELVCDSWWESRGKMVHTGEYGEYLDAIKAEFLRLMEEQGA